MILSDCEALVFFNAAVSRVCAEPLKSSRKFQEELQLLLDGSEPFLFDLRGSGKLDSPSVTCFCRKCFSCVFFCLSLELLELICLNFDDFISFFDVD